VILYERLRHAQNALRELIMITNLIKDNEMNAHHHISVKNNKLIFLSNEYILGLTQIIAVLFIFILPIMLPAAANAQQFSCHELGIEPKHDAHHSECKSICGKEAERARTGCLDRDHERDRDREPNHDRDHDRDADICINAVNNCRLKCESSCPSRPASP
jgi:hypothetical protein